MAGGNTITRLSEGAFRLAERPDHAMRWLRATISKSGSPLESGLPWISWKAIDHLNSLDFRDKIVYEYGGGGSTIFFASRGARVITCETHGEWTQLILAEAQRRGLDDRISISTFAVDSAGSKAEYLRHIRTVGPWDIAVIDGYDTTNKGDATIPLTRMECVPAVKETARTGCIVLIDDAWRPQYTEAPKLLAPAARKVFRGLGPHRPGVTQTDIYTF